MAKSEGPFWVVRAGKLGEADSLFLKEGYVALGWGEFANLTDIPNDPDTFKAKVRLVYPTAKPGVIPNVAGQLRRFAYEIKSDNLVLYPSRLDRLVHIGRVSGPYLYNPEINREFCHLHKVEWLKQVPRTHFTQGALYELGSAMTVFQVKNYADEFHAALGGQTVPAPPPSEDESVDLVTADVEETTRDFILKQLSQEFKGHPLAHFVAHLLNAMGYRTRVSPPGPDTGVDIVAHTDELGFLPPIIKVQVKSSDSNVGNHDVSALYGTLAPGEYGLFVTLSAFTAPAKAFANPKNNLRLIDGNELVDLVLQHYEQFDEAYKRKVPLKRVYVPRTVEEFDD